MAIIYGGFPYESPPHSARTSNASQTSRRTSNGTNATNGSGSPREGGEVPSARNSLLSSLSAQSGRSLVQADSFYGSIQPDRLTGTHSNC